MAAALGIGVALHGLVVVARKSREIGPAGNGGFEQLEGTAPVVGVVAEIGVAGLDKDDGFQPNLAHDGGEEDARIDTIGLTGVVDLVEEADVLDVGMLGGRRGAGDGGIGDAAFEGVIPDGFDLADHGLCILLIARDAGDDTLVEDVGEDTVDEGVLLIDVGGKEPAEVVEVPIVVDDAEEAVVGRAVIDADVFHIDFLVVDEAGEGEVGCALLADFI